MLVHVTTVSAALAGMDELTTIVIVCPLTD